MLRKKANGSAVGGLFLSVDDNLEPHSLASIFPTLAFQACIAMPISCTCPF